MTALDFARRFGDARFLIHAKWRAFEGGPVSDIAHILIADDHPLVLGALRQAVSGAIPGAFIHEAVDFESLAVALEQMPDMDLVLLDLSMPGVRGFSGLLFLRAERPSVPVIVVSGNEDRAVIRHCLEFGASAYVPKSLDIEVDAGRDPHGDGRRPMDAARFRRRLARQSRIRRAGAASFVFDATAGPRPDDALGGLAQQADRL